jgi:hypothetical protein
MSQFSRDILFRAIAGFFVIVGTGGIGSGRFGLKFGRGLRGLTQAQRGEAIDI